MDEELNSLPETLDTHEHQRNQDVGALMQIYRDWIKPVITFGIPKDKNGNVIPHKGDWF